LVFRSCWLQRQSGALIAGHDPDQPGYRPLRRNI